jgi:hypothetical protein
VLCKIFASQGFILYWDQAYALDPIEFFFTRRLHAWNHYGGVTNDVTSYALLIPYNALAWLGLPVDLAEKASILLNYALAGTFMVAAL